MKKSILELFEKEVGLTIEQVKIAQKTAQLSNKPIDEVLQELDFVTASEIAEVKALFYGIPLVDLNTTRPQPNALKLLKKEEATKRSILPLHVEKNYLTVAVDTLEDLKAISYLEHVTKMNIKFVMAQKQQILHHLQLDYHELDNPIASSISEFLKKASSSDDIDVNILVNLLLNSAIKVRATDVHVTPEKLAVNVFYRVDGVLQFYYSLPLELHANISVVIKNMCKLDISKKRLPQDGSFSYSFVDKHYDMRLSTMPTNMGENIVIRLLEKGVSLLSVKHLGLSQKNQSILLSYFKKPYGVILVTGPTGSGKTTTLYTALKSVDTLRKNVLTIEDPIEYQFSFIKQTQLNEKSGYNFDSAIKSFMRQDPDVILVGEIRDSQTATLAMRASITGHLVLSTLHTNDAISTIARLEDLGVKPYLIGSGLLCILNQRLVRKLCPNCKKPLHVDSEYLLSMGVSKSIINEESCDTIYEAVGCSTCNDSGYIGREVIIEILDIDEEVQSLIQSSSSATQIYSYIKKSNLHFLRDDGHLKVLQGITTFEEIDRVVN
ncbi:MAG: GspE/PulE family protein [Campylobacterota bacterium]|nr:GspE/PulE family protein [Campylobacterota bacterium]